MRRPWSWPCWCAPNCMTPDTLVHLLQTADVDRLLATDKTDIHELRWLLAVCRDLYNAGQALGLKHKGLRPSRIAMVREILLLRAAYLKLTPKVRASLKVGTQADRFEEEGDEEMPNVATAQEDAANL